MYKGITNKNNLTISRNSSITLNNTES